MNFGEIFDQFQKSMQESFDFPFSKIFADELG